MKMATPTTIITIMRTPMEAILMNRLLSSLRVRQIWQVSGPLFRKRIHILDEYWLKYVLNSEFVSSFYNFE